MRFRSSVAIDLGTVNTLVWVAGRGIVIEEPTAIAIDTAVGKVAAVGEAADALADKEPQDIEVIHPLRDGVIADLDATAAMLHAFLRRTRPGAARCGPTRWCACRAARTAVERRSIVAALCVRRPRYHVRLIDEPVAAAAGAGFDLTGGAGGFVVDIGGGTTEVAAVAGWRVVRAQSLRKAGNAMDEAIVQAARNELGLIISQRAARQLKMTPRRDRRSRGLGGGRRPRRRAPHAAVGERARVDRRQRAGADRLAPSPRPCTRCCPTSRRASPRMWSAGKIRLAGGGALLPGLAARIETIAGIAAMVVDDPLRCVVRGAAEILERTGNQPGPDLRGCTGPDLRG